MSLSFYRRHPEEAKEYARQYYRDNKDRLLAKKREYDHAHKEKIASARKAKRAADPVAARAYARTFTSAPLARAKTRLQGSRQQAKKRGYLPLDLTPEEVLVHLRKERCECCGKHIRGTQQQLDHNHQTGKFRGVLCARCNLMVGVLENPLLSKAQDYLTRSEQ